VLAVLWALPRPTADVDFVEVGPSDAGQDLLTVAGEGSEITPRGFTHLRPRALEVHDLVLAKLGRNSARDRADVGFLVRRGAVDGRLLEARFAAELRPYVLNEDRHKDAFRL